MAVELSFDEMVAAIDELLGQHVRVIVGVIAERRTRQLAFMEGDLFGGGLQSLPSAIADALGDHRGERAVYGVTPSGGLEIVRKHFKGGQRTAYGLRFSNGRGRVWITPVVEGLDGLDLDQRAVMEEWWDDDRGAWGDSQPNSTSHDA